MTSDDLQPVVVKFKKLTLFENYVLVVGEIYVRILLTSSKCVLHSLLSLPEDQDHLSNNTSSRNNHVDRMESSEPMKTLASVIEVEVKDDVTPKWSAVYLERKSLSSLSWHRPHACLDV